MWVLKKEDGFTNIGHNYLEIMKDQSFLRDNYFNLYYKGSEIRSAISSGYLRSLSTILSKVDVSVQEANKILERVSDFKSSEDMRFGTIIHKIIEEWLKGNKSYIDNFNVGYSFSDSLSTNQKKIITENRLHEMDELECVSAYGEHYSNKIIRTALKDTQSNEFYKVIKLIEPLKEEASNYYKFKDSIEDKFNLSLQFSDPEWAKAHLEECYESFKDNTHLHSYLSQFKALYPEKVFIINTKELGYRIMCDIYAEGDKYDSIIDIKVSDSPSVFQQYYLNKRLPAQLSYYKYIASKFTKKPIDLKLFVIYKKFGISRLYTISTKDLELSFNSKGYSPLRNTNIFTGKNKTKLHGFTKRAFPGTLSIKQVLQTIEKAG